MNVDFMRCVDFWVGVPLCFLFSLLNSLFRLFGFRRPQPGFRPRRIVFIELSEMGSAILAYTAMKKAKELFGAELYFMIFRKNAESVQLLGLIPEANLITIRNDSFLALFADTFRAIVKMRSLGIDAVVDLELFSRYSSLLSFFSPARAIVGYHRFHMEGLYRGNFRTHRVLYNPYYHASRNFLALVYALADDPRDEPMLKRHISPAEIECARVTPSAEEKALIYGKLQAVNPSARECDAFVLLSIGASQLLPVREWPIENYKKLAEQILRTGNAYVVIVGVAADKKNAQAICEFVRDSRCIDFTGKTANLRELTTLFALSKVLVTNDSGPAHFAALTGIRTFVLFGPETPFLYSPLGPNCEPLYANLACSPCVSAYNHRKTSCRNNVCLQSISVDEVFGRVKGAMEGQ